MSTVPDSGLPAASDTVTEYGHFLLATGVWFAAWSAPCTGPLVTVERPPAALEAAVVVALALVVLDEMPAFVPLDDEDDEPPHAVSGRQTTAASKARWIYRLRILVPAILRIGSAG